MKPDDDILAPSRDIPFLSGVVLDDFYMKEFDEEWVTDITVRNARNIDIIVDDGKLENLRKLKVINNENEKDGFDIYKLEFMGKKSLIHLKIIKKN